MEEVIQIASEVNPKLNSDDFSTVKGNSVVSTWLIESCFLESLITFHDRISSDFAFEEQQAAKHSSRTTGSDFIWTARGISNKHLK